MKKKRAERGAIINALLSMKVGETSVFPLESYSSILSTKSRLKSDMWKEGVEWVVVGKKDYKNGVFHLKRES